MSSDAHIFPQPSEGDLSAPKEFMLMLNPYWWSIVQGEMRHIDSASRWGDYDAVESDIQQLFIPSEIIDAEWVQVLDFRVAQSGFSVVSGGGGTWVSGLGFRSDTVTGGVEAHIEKTFTETGIVGLLIFFTLSTNAANVNDLSAKLMTSGGEVTMYSSNPPNVSNQDIMVEGTTYEGVTRIRLRLFSTSANRLPVRIERLIFWGIGDEPS